MTTVVVCVLVLLAVQLVGVALCYCLFGGAKQEEPKPRVSLRVKRGKVWAEKR